MRYKAQVSFRKVSTFLVVFLHANLISAQLYATVESLEDILKMEKVLISTLQNYVSAGEQRISLLKRHSQMYTNHLKGVSGDVEAHVSNPINAFNVIKKLTADWNRTENLIMKNVPRIDFMTKISSVKRGLKLPTNEDLYDAAVAITRLQDAHKLETFRVARGEFNGVRYNTQLSAEDCFELAAQLFDHEDHEHSVQWMREANYRSFNEDSRDPSLRVKILEHASYSYYELGDIRMALNLTEELLKLSPNDPSALRNKIIYQDMLNVEALEVESNQVEALGVTESGVSAGPADSGLCVNDEGDLIDIAEASSVDSEECSADDGVTEPGGIEEFEGTTPYPYITEESVTEESVTEERLTGEMLTEDNLTEKNVPERNVIEKSKTEEDKIDDGRTEDGSTEAGKSSSRNHPAITEEFLKVEPWRF